jgi:3-oxoadipate enol-lactonase
MTRLRFARSGRLRIAFRVHTSPLHRRRPWLLMIQGLGFDHTGWDPVIPALHQRFRLILMDNRGCGDSDLSDRAFSVPALAQDAVAVLDAAGVRRAHLLGASLGGMVAQELAVDHADRVQDLVLACTTPGWPHGYPMPSASVRLMSSSRRMTTQESLRRYVENALSAKTVAQRPELVEQLVRHQQEHPSDQAAWMSLNLAGARYYGGNRSSRIAARTLVLHGTDDTVVDPRNGGYLAEHVPAAELTMLPGLGHLFFWEQPKALTDAVVAFLERSAPSTD